MREDVRDSAGGPESLISHLETAPEGQGGLLDMSESIRINKMDKQSQIGMEHQQSNLSADPPVSKRSKWFGAG